MPEAGNLICAVEGLIPQYQYAHIALTGIEPDVLPISKAIIHINGDKKRGKHPKDWEGTLQVPETGPVSFASLIICAGQYS